jgi:hypothetical protein
VGKKLLVLAIASVVAVVLLEIAAAQLYRRFKGRQFARSEIVARLYGASAEQPEVPAAQAANDPRVADQAVMIHPYFGYVNDPTRVKSANRFGFFGPEPFATRSPDVALVAVFGGSVADQLAKTGIDALSAALTADGPFRDRRIEVINLSLGGYKQPQQMLILAGLLAFGAQFDLVINLDGFNEIDGAQDNLQDGVNPFYPYTWNLHSRQAFDGTASVHMAKADLIRAERAELRNRFARWPVQYSVFLLSLWDFLDQRQEARLRSETTALRDALAASAATPQQTGPHVAYADDDTMYRDFIEVWARASIEMNLLCAGYGIRYLHFLQPNQYLPGSKALTAEELKVAFDQDVADTGRVATAYPMLSERGRDLQTQGVEFVDLSMLFRDEPRSVYGDTCCHLNGLGNELLAQAIAAEVNREEPPAEEAAPQPAEQGGEVPEGAAMEPDAAPAGAAGEGSAPPEPAGAAAPTAAAEAAPEEQGAQ